MYPLLDLGKRKSLGVPVLHVDKKRDIRDDLRR